MITQLRLLLALSHASALLIAPRRSIISARTCQPVASENLGISRATALQQLSAAAGVVALGIEPRAARAAYPGLSITTTQGVMEFELWDDVAPKHVDSIRTLAKQGFFDGQAFHRIIPGFVIQGGDPNSKIGYGADGTLEAGDKGAQRRWGTGGPGYNIKAEFNPRKHEFGVLSMARSSDPDSAGSQFFVCLGTLPNLDDKYTTFGKMTKGDDVLRKIAAAKTGSQDRPLVRQGIERADPL